MLGRILRALVTPQVLREHMNQARERNESDIGTLNDAVRFEGKD